MPFRSVEMFKQVNSILIFFFQIPQQRTWRIFWEIFEFNTNLHCQNQKWSKSLLSNTILIHSTGNSEAIFALEQKCTTVSRPKTNLRRYLAAETRQRCALHKGQLISEWDLGVFNSFKKQTWKSKILPYSRVWNKCSPWIIWQKE